MPVVVDVTHVEQALQRELDKDERPWVGAMLDYLEALVELKCEGLSERAMQPGALQVVYRMVLGEAAARVLRSPSGGLYKYETEGTYTYSINQAVASGVLELTDRDWDNLKGGSGGWGSHDPSMDGYVRNRLRRMPVGVTVRVTERPNLRPDPYPLEAGLGPVSDLDMDVWGDFQ